MCEKIKKGLVIEKYTLLKLIGEGGMGTVWKAEKEGKEYAIKFCLRNDEKSILRFEREYRLMSSLNHSNVLKAYDYNKYNEIPYIVMELAETSIQELIPKGISITEKFRYSRQICDAVQYIHDSKESHRDIKAPNVLLVDGQCKLGDFGIARFLDRDTVTLTTTNESYHSIGYDAPELLKSGEFREGDFSIDIYALGSLLYFIFSDGSEPYFFNYNMVPPDVLPILLKCRAYEPKERYINAISVSSALAKVEASRSVYINLGELWKQRNKHTTSEIVGYALPIIYKTSNLEELMGNLPIINKIVPMIGDKTTVEAIARFVLDIFQRPNDDGYWIQFQDVEDIATLGAVLYPLVDNVELKNKIFEWAFEYSKNYNRWAAMRTVYTEIIKKWNEESIKPMIPYIQSHQEEFEEFATTIGVQIPLLVRSHF